MDHPEHITQHSIARELNDAGPESDSAKLRRRPVLGEHNAVLGRMLISVD